VLDVVVGDHDFRGTFRKIQGRGSWKNRTSATVFPRGSFRRERGDEVERRRRWRRRHYLTRDDSIARRPAPESEFRRVGGGRGRGRGRCAGRRGRETTPGGCG